jgi:hypothetical protein
MKKRGICFGSFVFLGIIISLVAGCNLGVTPETGSGPLMDENGNYIISVNTPLAKSITAADASLYAKEYEIVCYDGTDFYSGYTMGGNLTVTLPAGTYDMLLLAGNGSQTLLGTGWLSPQTIGPDTGSVTITVDPLTILESEMVFTDNATPTPTSSPPTTGTPPSFAVDTTATTLDTTFTLHNMGHLEAAAVAAGGTDIYTDTGGFAAKRVVMEYCDDSHKPLILQAELDAGSPPGDPVLTFDSPLTYASGGDWSALVYLDLQYIPFSQTTAPASAHRWSILNGLGKTASTGAVLVTAGNGGGYDVNVAH